MTTSSTSGQMIQDNNRLGQDAGYILRLCLIHNNSYISFSLTLNKLRKISSLRPEIACGKNTRPTNVLDLTKIKSTQWLSNEWWLLASKTGNEHWTGEVRGYQTLGGY